jgi:zinc transporter 9
MASISIGLMLGAIAIWIGVQNRTLLIGRSIPNAVRDEIVAYMRKDPAVERVTETRTLVLGAQNYKVACDVDFDGRLLGRRLAPLLAERAGEIAEPAQCEELAADLGELVLEELAVEIDRIEAELKERHPELTHLALEADE